MRLKLTLGVTAALMLVLPTAAHAVKTVAPSSLNFPPTALDQQSAPQTVTVGIGAADSGGRFTSPFISECGAGGACQACSPGGFCNWKVVGTTCPILPAEFLPGDQTCTISVAFTPYDSPGPELGKLSPGNDFPTAALSGTSQNEGSGGGTGKKKKCKKKGKKGAAAAKKKKCGKKKK